MSIRCPALASELPPLSRSALRAAFAGLASDDGLKTLVLPDFGLLGGYPSAPLVGADGLIRAALQAPAPFIVDAPRRLLRAMGAPATETGSAAEAHPPLAFGGAAPSERVQGFDPDAETPEVLLAIASAESDRSDSPAIFAACPGPVLLAALWIAPDLATHADLVKRFAYAERAQFMRLLDRMVDGLIAYLGALVDAGADALWLTDPFAAQFDARVARDDLAPALERFVLIARALEVPVFLEFPGGPQLLGFGLDLGPSAMVIDWRADAREAMAASAGRGARVLSIDPAIAAAPKAERERRIERHLTGLEGGPSTFLGLPESLIVARRGAAQPSSQEGA